MLLPLKPILEKAKKDKYAVIAVNVFNYETIKAAIEAGWEEKSPIILNFGEVLEEIVPMDDFVKMVEIVNSKYKLPLCINLDHSLEYGQCIRAIRAGFTSIMVDRSAQPFDVNVKETKKLVKIAHSVGVSVEAELGHVGLGQDYGQDMEDNLTNPDLAGEFVKKTEIDALAIAIGTAHGPYRGVAKIDFERLKAIREKVNIPLVLHGGSMTGDEKLQRLAQSGINKINIGTDLDIAAMEGFNSQDMGPGWELPKRLDLARDFMKEKIKHYIRIFGSNNKV